MIPIYPPEAPRGDDHVRVDTDRIVGGSKLLAEMRHLIRRKYYSIRTEQAQRKSEEKGSAPVIQSP